MKQSDETIKKIGVTLGLEVKTLKKGFFGKHLVAQGKYNNRDIVVYSSREKTFFYNGEFRILISLKNKLHKELDVKTKIGDLSLITSKKIKISILEKGFILNTKETTVTGLKKIIDYFYNIAGNFE